MSTIVVTLKSWLFLVDLSPFQCIKLREVWIRNQELILYELESIKLGMDPSLQTIVVSSSDAPVLVGFLQSFRLTSGNTCLHASTGGDETVGLMCTLGLVTATGLGTMTYRVTLYTPAHQ